MKAVILDGFGGREVLGIGEVETPTIKPGQVLIKVEATSINRADITQRQENYPAPPGESEILGLEAAGVIEAVGPDVEGWKKGDRVMSLVAGGGYAEYAAAYAAHLIPIPESISFEEAACISEVYITVFLNIFRNG
jgi:NADPH:quinone reductase